MPKIGRIFLVLGLLLVLATPARALDLSPQGGFGVLTVTSSEAVGLPTDKVTNAAGNMPRNA